MKYYYLNNHTTITSYVSALDCSVNVTITNGEQFGVSIKKGYLGKKFLLKLTSGQSIDIKLEMYEKK